jgi:hypothetical protein
MQLKKPRLFTSDHYLILGEFLSEPLRENRRYLGGRRRFPLHATAPVSEVEKLFADIQAACADPIPPERPPRPSWISSETWNLIDHRAERRRQSDFSDTESSRLNRRIRKALLGRSKAENGNGRRSH